MKLTKKDPVTFGGVKYPNFPCFGEILPTNRARNTTVKSCIYLKKKTNKPMNEQTKDKRHSSVCYLK